MATKKKSSGGRKKSTTAAATATKKFAGKTYSKASCHKTKTEAKKAAERARAAGKNARVVKSGTANCVYVRGAGR